MPIWNWHRLHEDGSMAYVFRNHTVPITPELAAQAKTQWKALLNEFLRTFGMAERFVRLLAKERHIAKLRCKKALTGDRSIQTFIDIEVGELAAMKARTLGSQDFYQNKGAIESRMGFRIDVKNTSVTEYYNYIKALDNGGK